MPPHFMSGLCIMAPKVKSPSLGPFLDQVSQLNRVSHFYLSTQRYPGK